MRVCASAAAVVLGSAAAFGQTFDCTVQQAPSGINATITLNSTAPGTLIGNYDAATNAAGTRTKPGFFGSFGSTENLPVNITIAGGITNYRVNEHPSGSFVLQLDPEGLAAYVRDYSVNFIASGAISVPVTARFTTDAFRTRNPSSTYIAGSINVPVANASITELRAVQTSGAVGTLTATGPNQYTFAVPITIDLIYQADFLGNPVGSTGGNPTPAVVAGTVTLNNDGTATITTSQDISSTTTQQPNQALPQTAFALPTILPPGGTANVLLNLTLQSVEATTTGTVSLVVTGQPHVCIADFNQDGGIDGGDVESFFAAWESGSASADVNRDGGVDFGDVATFFRAWESGSC